MSKEEIFESQALPIEQQEKFNQNFQTIVSILDILEIEKKESFLEKLELLHNWKTKKIKKFLIDFNNLPVEEKKEILEILEKIKKALNKSDDKIKKLILNSTTTSCAIEKIGEFNTQKEELEFYINSLIFEAKHELYEVLDGEYGNILGKKGDFLHIQKDRQQYIVKNRHKITEKNKGFDDINIYDSKEIDGNFYYKVKINEKWGYIKFEEENTANINFEDVRKIKKIGNKIVYEAKIENNWIYIEYGKEENEKIIFEKIGKLEEVNGKVFYKASLNKKQGYIILGEEKNYKNFLIFEEVKNINSPDHNRIFYSAIYTAGKEKIEILIEYGKEQEALAQITSNKILGKIGEIWSKLTFWVKFLIPKTKDKKNNKFKY